MCYILEQLQALADGITGLVQDIRNDDAIHKASMSNKNKIGDQVKTIKPCDGSVAADVREYLEDIELSIPLLNGIPNATIEVVTRTVIGSLRKEVERFLATQPNRLGTPWNLLKEHISRTFLSANEGEKLKIELEKITQPSYETIPMFNRKFREVEAKAYPLPRTLDAERVVIRAYARALYDTSIARKLITEGNPEELEAALTYTEHIAAGIELFDNIQRVRREEPMEIGALHSAREVVSPEKHAMLQKELEGVKQQNERLMTRIAKLEIQQKQTQVGDKPGRGHGMPLHRVHREERKVGRPPVVCHFCNKVGHIARECYRKQKQQQGN